MRKLLFTTLAVIAAAIVFAPQAEAATLQFGLYDAGGKVAADWGGEQTDIMYYPGVGGALESSWTTGGAGGCVTNSSGTQSPYPVVGGLADLGVGCRTPGVMLVGATSANMVDAPLNPDPAGAGAEYVVASSYLTIAPGAWGAPGATIDHANTTTTLSTGQYLTIVYNSFGTTDAAAATVDMGGFGGGFNPPAMVPVGHPVGGGSKTISFTAPYPPGTPYAHLRFPSGIMPGPTAGGSFFQTGNVVVPAPGIGDPALGVRIYRNNTTNIAVAVPLDYGVLPVDLGNAGGSGTVMRWDGVGMDPDKLGASALGDFYFNDLGGNTPGPLSYVTSPVLIGDPANPQGIELFYQGSWGPSGQPGDAGLLPAPATVVSFDATFDPRTGKVTLNWRSAAEQELAGYNVWRQLSLDGRPLGEKVLVGSVDAEGGPAEYSLTDEPDVSKLGRLARGRPIDADYSLEEVNLDGTTNVIKTTSVQLTKSRARRSR